MPSYFLFSDAHLGAPHRSDDPERERKVVAFLQHVKQHGAGLFIVGDLFDFWFEYRHAVPNRHFAVLAKLYELRQAGLPIDYLAGNHDLWLGEYFRNQIGVTVHAGGIARNLCGYHCFITHGDGTAKRDVGYRLLKRIMQHPVNIFLYRLLTPDLGVPLAKSMSHTSRTYVQSDSRWEREYRAYAAGKINEGFDVVLMGHTHQPKVEQINGKMFINLGDWMTHFTYCRLDERGPVLLRWSDAGQPAAVAAQAAVSPP